ncbi:MAG: GerMN domain-containing protein [Lachnospiraceae bacterium]|nr:GerMN domain-containing protein [Lachnospiraceae bacterium]
MKKNIFFAVLAVALVSLSACGSKQEYYENTIQVYCLNQTETSIESHSEPLPETSLGEQLKAVEEYLGTVPEKMQYKPPLSLGFNVQKATIDEGKLLLDFSEEYLNLSKTTEVLVRAALVRTFTQLEGIRFVGITVNGEAYYDAAGEQVGLMNADLFINNDGNEINTYELTKVKLYFATEEGKLVAAYREKYYSTNTPLERFIVDEIISGPSGQIEELKATVNPETKVINVTSNDGICYVNLDAAFLTGIDGISMDQAVYSLVDSLTELSYVKKVQILVNGEVPVAFSNSVFEKNIDIVTTLDDK